MEQLIRFQVNAGEHRRRLEDVLCGRFGGLSKMYLRELIKSEQCEVNGRYENRGCLVRANDLIEICVDLTRETAMRPEDVAIYIIYEDANLVVVNKPPGMLVHPSYRDRNGTLLNALAFHLNRTSIAVNDGERIRPGLIHRLDKDTSGIMVIAKDAVSHRRLAGHFQRKLVEKRYTALTAGVVAADEGTIEAPIGRFPELKHWNVKSDGKPSTTRFWVRQRFADRTLIELEPVTGRTNQLRIHCEFIGHPIIGDVKRGGPEHSRLCLHASKLAFNHPASGKEMSFASEPDFIDQR